MQTNATSTVHDSSAKKSIADLEIQKKIILIKKVRYILLFIYTFSNILPVVTKFRVFLNEKFLSANIKDFTFGHMKHKRLIDNMSFHSIF